MKNNKQEYSEILEAIARRILTAVDAVSVRLPVAMPNGWPNKQEYSEILEAIARRILTGGYAWTNIQGRAEDAHFLYRVAALLGEQINEPTEDTTK